MTRLGFRLKNPLGLAYTMDEDDVLKIKTALRDLGHMKKPDYGFTAYPDRPMIDGIRKFQRRHGLKPDGVAKPGGPTERRLDDVLSGSGGGGRSTARAIMPGEWDWLRNPERYRRRRERYPMDEKPDNLLEERSAFTGRRSVLPPADGPEPTGHADAEQETLRSRPPADQVAFAQFAPILWPLLGQATSRAAPHLLGGLTAAGTGAAVYENLKRDRSTVRRPDAEDNAPAQRTDPAPVFPPLSPSKPPRDRKPDREEFPAKPPYEPIDLSKPLPAEKEPTIFILPMPPEDLTKPVGIERNETEATKKQIDRIRDEIQAQRPEWEHVAGGRNKKTGKNEKEYYVPGPGLMFPRPGKEKGDGRRLSGFTDLTFMAKDGKTYFHIQTVDIDRDCKPTKRELDNAELIHKRLKDAKDETRHIFLYRKRWQRKGC